MSIASSLYLDLSNPMHTCPLCLYSYHTPLPLILESQSKLNSSSKNYNLKYLLFVLLRRWSKLPSDRPHLPQAYSSYDGVNSTTGQKNCLCCSTEWSMCQPCVVWCPLWMPNTRNYLTRRTAVMLRARRKQRQLKVLPQIYSSIKMNSWTCC